MAKFRKPLLFALCLLPVALVAGIFVSIYQLDTYSEDMIEEIVAQIGSTGTLMLVGAVQSAGCAFICGFFGYILSEKLGLWRPIVFDKKSLITTFAVSLAGGIVFSLDHWTFGAVIDGIQSANKASLTVSGVIASVLYGGVIEEVLLRLFFMSLIAFVVWKLFFRKYGKENIPVCVFVIANFAAAMLFAAGHLPANSVLFGELTPIILFRCFLLNGGFGLVFGLLYRKYGIVYAMMSHATFHVVSKLIWIIFA